MNYKKLMCSTIAGMMVMTMLAAPVAAVTTTDYTIDTTKKTSLTLVKIKENDGHVKDGNGLADSTVTNVGMQGIQFGALKIADLVSVTGGNQIGFYFDNVDRGYLDLLSAAGVTTAQTTINSHTYYTTEDLSASIKAMNLKAGSTPGEVQLNNYVRNNPSTKRMPATDSAGKTTLTGLDQGLYLVSEIDYSAYVAQAGRDTDVNTDPGTKEVVYNPTSPFLVSLPMTDQSSDAASKWMYDVTVYPKNQTATIPKFIVQEGSTILVQSDDREIGEPFEQVLTPSAPVVIEGNKYEKYVVTDTMVKGLAFVKVNQVKLGAKVVNPKDKNDFSSFETLTEGTDYRVNGTAGDRTFSVEFLAAGLAKLSARTVNSQVAVFFDSVLTKEAQDGDASAMTNKPTLTWKNQATEEMQVEGNEPRVYTYRLNVEKKGVTDATKVSFGVVRMSDNQAVSFVEESSGLYHLFDNDKDNTSAKTEVIRPSRDGHLTIRGLDDETYEFTEKSTENGHELLKSKFQVKLVGNDPVDGNLEAATLSTDGKEADITINKGTASFSAENFASIVLRTGGAGTVAVYIGAACALAASIAAYLMMRRKRRA